MRASAILVWVKHMILWTSFTILWSFTHDSSLFCVTFPRPITPGPNPCPSSPAPGRIYLLQPPTMELLFHGPQHQQLPFLAPSNNNCLQCLFLLLFKTKLNPKSIWKFLSAKSLIIHKRVNCNRFAVFLNRLEIYKRNNFCRNNVKQNIYFKWKTKHKTKSYC